MLLPWFDYDNEFDYLSIRTIIVILTKIKWFSFSIVLFLSILTLRKVFYWKVEDILNIAHCRCMLTPIIFCSSVLAPSMLTTKVTIRKRDILGQHASLHKDTFYENNKRRYYFDIYYLTSLRPCFLVVMLVNTFVPLQIFFPNYAMILNLRKVLPTFRDTETFKHFG